jgi:predicted small integral membrane protein
LRWHRCQDQRRRCYAEDLNSLALLAAVAAELLATLAFGGVLFLTSRTFRESFGISAVALRRLRRIGVQLYLVLIMCLVVEGGWFGFWVARGL